MLYDQAAEPPTPGSLLESVFVLMALRKQEVEYYRTKLMVASQVASHSEEGANMLSKAWDDYRDAVFPFLAKQKSKADEESKRVLDWWGKRMLKIKPIWRAQDHRPIISNLKRGQERVRRAEELRRMKPHRRI
jgi:hypothetical protein